ncbi:MAG: hypothetical protein CM15mV21_1240 [Eurybiavirus sp.]|nr:MAG: hypothetical protein CM15mV21_1240 [Eurybiavirus sp.]
MGRCHLKKNILHSPGGWRRETKKHLTPFVNQKDAAVQKDHLSFLSVGCI